MEIDSSKMTQLKIRPAFFFSLAVKVISSLICQLYFLLPERNLNRFLPQNNVFECCCKLRYLRRQLRNKLHLVDSKDKF